MQVTLADDSLVIVRPRRTLTQKTFERVCRENPNLRVERTETGEMLIIAPSGNETSYRNLKILGQLDARAAHDGRGKVFDSNTVFRLPDGSRLGPDAAWISNQSLARFTARQRAGFLPIAPEFVIELKSPSDRIGTQRKKMADWMRNGVQLGWLIDPAHRIVWVYRQSEPAQKLMAPETVAGEGPIAGFELRLSSIYRGLSS